MLINIFGAWVNPHNITAVIAEGEGSSIVFSANDKGFTLKFADKSPADVAAEINNALAASRKKSFGDRDKKYGDKDRGGFRGGRDRDSGFEKKYDRKRDDRDDRGSRSDRGERSFGEGNKRDDKPRGGFDKKEGFDKKKGKYGAKASRGDFTPKKRKDW